MYKPKKKAPDKVALFQIGIIIALLLVNVVFNISYTTPYLDEPEDPNDEGIAVTYHQPYQIPEPKKEEEKIEEAKIIPPIPFNPNQRIVLVKKLPDVKTNLFKKAAGKQVPSGLPGPIVPFNKPDSSMLIFKNVEQMPRYPGGEDARFRFIQDEFHLSDQFINYVSSATLEVQFVVNVDGSVSDIRIISCSSKGVGLEREAKRVIKAMPRWEPAQHKGKPVRYRVRQPLTLRSY